MAQLPLESMELIQHWRDNVVISTIPGKANTYGLPGATQESSEQSKYTTFETVVTQPNEMCILIQLIQKQTTKLGRMNSP